RLRARLSRAVRPVGGRGCGNRRRWKVLTSLSEQLIESRKSRLHLTAELETSQSCLPRVLAAPEEGGRLVVLRLQRKEGRRPRQLGISHENMDSDRMRLAL